MRSNNILKYEFCEDGIISLDVDFQVDEKIDIINILLNKIKNNDLKECHFENHCNEKISMVISDRNKDCLICFSSLFNDDIHNFIIEGTAKWFKYISKFIDVDLTTNRFKIYFDEKDITFCADYKIVKFSIDKN